MKIGVYAGTFDPLTRGHWDLIVKGVKLFDKLIIGIGKNPGKNPMFSAEERKFLINESIIKHMLANQHNLNLINRFGNIEIEIFDDEFLVKYAERKNANYILRGLRDSEDFRQEQAYSFFNRGAAPEIETIYLMPHPQYAAVSSSAIKSMIGPQGWQDFIRPYLTDPVYDAILRKHNVENRV